MKDVQEGEYQRSSKTSSHCVNNVVENFATNHYLGLNIFCF